MVWFGRLLLPAAWLSGSNNIAARLMLLSSLRAQPSAIRIRQATMDKLPDCAVKCCLAGKMVGPKYPAVLPTDKQLPARPSKHANGSVCQFIKIAARRGRVLLGSLRNSAASLPLHLIRPCPPGRWQLVSARGRPGKRASEVELL